MKLSRSESSRKAYLNERLEDATKALSEEVDRSVTDFEKLDTAVFAYNEVIVETNEFASDVANRLREAYDEKSEKFKDSDKGSALDEFAAAWESFDGPKAENDGEFEDMTSDFDSLPEESDE